MATLEFSQAAINRLGSVIFAMPQNQLGGWNTQIYASGYLSSATSNCQLRIMKGSPPSTWTELSAPTSRSSDILVTFDNTGDQIKNNSSLSAGQNYVSIATPFATATQTGTASWFWLINFNGSTVLQQLVGTTITAVGGGGDLEITSTSIVSGSSYRVTGLYIEFPRTWTY